MRMPTFPELLSRQNRSAAATWAATAESLGGVRVVPFGVTLTTVSARLPGGSVVSVGGSVVATTSATSSGGVPGSVAAVVVASASSVGEVVPASFAASATVSGTTTSRVTVLPGSMSETASDSTGTSRSSTRRAVGATTCRAPRGCPGLGSTIAVRRVPVSRTSSGVAASATVGLTPPAPAVASAARAAHATVTPLRSLFFMPLSSALHVTGPPPGLRTARPLGQGTRRAWTGRSASTRLWEDSRRD